MPWKEVSTRSQRKEFIVFATQPARNIRALCRAFAISPKTGYKWLARYAAEGELGLQARSRRPHQMPQRTPDALEQAILQLRVANPRGAAGSCTRACRPWAMRRSRRT